MSKITPGPWDFVSRFIGPFVVVADVDKLIDKSGKMEVAYVGADSMEIAVANARAISAVPDMMEALNRVLIGGNHLGLVIGADHPPHTATHDEARKHYGAGDKYEAWCCWREIMNARSALAKARGET